MARRSDHSREELREMALAATEEIIDQQGLAGLTARKVAAGIGYTVGTLYLVFRNLDDLIDLTPQNGELALGELMEREIEKEVGRFKRFCIERNIVTLLEDTQRRREVFIHELIPSIVESEFSELDERTQKQVEARMKQLIREYSSNSFDSIHDALDNYWSSM